ncbi:sigma-54-dependent Fis family transcriptional regulator [Rhodovulum sulfidophilum]|nr:sigma-54-dependent Fis family transcriptional regulator [Rhodovulum sulfidophilum]
MSGTCAHVDVVHSAIAAGNAARSPMVASWSRSARLYGLDPANRKPPHRLTAAEFANVRERMEPWIRAAGASLDRLFGAVGAAGCCVLLADSDGVPVERRGVAGDDATFDDWGLWPGALWSEATEGTNGIGTCVIERRPVTVHRDQHFLARNGALGCIAAPIHDHDGELVGVLDVSSCRTDLTATFAGLIALSVREAARRIEAEAFRRSFAHARILAVSGLEHNPAALVAVTADDLAIGASHGARVALGIKGNLAKAPVPASDLLSIPGVESLEEAERAVLARALARTGGNVSAAARILGISRATFHRKLGHRKSGAKRPEAATQDPAAPCRIPATDAPSLPRDGG